MNILLLQKCHWRKSTQKRTTNKYVLLGCGVTTGTGAVHNTAKVQEGDFLCCGCIGFPGAIGLAVVQGARQAKAGRIIAIDTNPAKFELAKRFGATDCLNPKRLR